MKERMEKRKEGQSMENRYTAMYDLLALMKQGDLNIRKITSTTQNMPVGEYFGMLEEMLGRAPAFLEDLNRIINRVSVRSTYRNLVSMFELLTNLGYEKHVDDFMAIHDANDKCQPRIAAIHAKKIEGSIVGLCSRVLAARLADPPEDSGADPDGTPLWEFVENLIIEETNRKKVVFAVDDSLVTLKSVNSLLSDEYKVYTLAKSTMLEKMLGQIKPDLFLLDYMMPEINGFELVPIIRSFDEHKNTPIVFLTSVGTADNLSAAGKLGACDFIVKPVQPNILREKIARHIA